MDFSTNYRINVNPVGLSGSAAATYKRKVTEHLTWIYKTKVGKMLLGSIRFHGLPVEIRPYTGGDCNAVGGGETPVGGTFRGVVMYSPDTFSLHGACSATQTVKNSGLLWDEILFHELVHVLRNVSGKWNKQPLSGGLFRYDDTEEFFAVMVSNIYISDRSNKIKTSLRSDHQTFNPLNKDFAEPFGFFASGMQALSLVKQFISDNRGFSLMVAHVGAPFNPIADYLASPDRAEQIAKTALPRDIAGLVVDLAEWSARVLH
jgi:hypothetical protein